MQQFIKILFFILTFYLYIIPNSCYAQNNSKKLIAEFDSLPLIIKQGDVISKTLKVINTDSINENYFSLNITYPGGWKLLTNTEKEYIIPPKDTFYIPVRIVPIGKVLGNTKYLIYAYVINENSVPVASAHFLAEKQKLIKWDINVYPDEKIYLKNDESSASFSVNLFNVGSEQLELILDINNYRKDRIALMDTNDRILKRPIYTTKLQQKEDTNFYFKAKYIHGLRNYRLIDIDNYVPNNKNIAQRYSLFAQSKESALTGVGSIQKSKRISIIHLTDEVIVNPYGYSSFPLIMEANVSNFIGSQPIMNLFLRGGLVVNKDDYLTYSTSTYFSTYFANPQVITNSYFNIGYLAQKFDIQIGNVGGGFGGGGGKGISGHYVISKKHKVGAFFTRGHKFIDADRTSFGANYSFMSSFLKYQTDITHIIYTKNKQYTDFFKNTFSIPLMRGHNVGFGAIVARRVSTDIINPFTSIGYSLNASYGGRFFNNRLQSSVNSAYTSSNYTGSNYGQLWHINLNNSFKVKKKLSFTLFNYYNRRYAGIQPEQIVFNNTLNLNTQIFKVPFTPSIFYNIVNIDNRRFHSRGLSMNYGKYDYETTRLVALNLRGGYNRAIDIPELRDYFFFQSFIIYKYRVWSANLRYSYGSLAPTDLSFLRGVYPQSIGFSINYQHQFKNPHFVLDNNFTYNYYSNFKKQSFSYTPQLYYFTNTGWRLYFQPGYYLSVSRRLNQRIPQYNGTLEQKKSTVSQSVLINIGVKKEFGIPIPWRKEKFPTYTFLAFIDHNGNNKQDAGEVPLENVVIKMGEWEILTNENGMATIKNVYKDSTYNFAVFSLIDLQGYFPHIPEKITTSVDTLYYIPFVKGVKVHGNVYMDREKVAADLEKPLDLSGIKITANNGKASHTLSDGKGDFSFYVPYGKYTVSMDEKVLGDRFSLLQNNIELELGQNTESIFITFYIVEKRRKVNIKKFNGNGHVVKGSETTVQPKTKSLEDLKKEENQRKIGTVPTEGNNVVPASTPKEGKEKVINDEDEDIGDLPFDLLPNSPSDEGQRPANISADYYTLEQILSEGAVDKSFIKFKVQVGIYKDKVAISMIKKLIQLGYVETGYTTDGMVRYTSGKYDDFESAKKFQQELLKLGYKGAFVLGEYKWKNISAQDALKLLKM